MPSKEPSEERHPSPISKCPTFFMQSRVKHCLSRKRR